jgi:hypothetical protein
MFVFTDSAPAPVPPNKKIRKEGRKERKKEKKKERKNERKKERQTDRKKERKKEREECEMLEKAFTIPTSAAATASAEDECRSFGNFIGNRLQIYLLRTRNTVQYEISNIIIAAYQGHFDVSYPVPTPSPAFQVSSPTTPCSAAGSEDVILSDLMCLQVV